LTKNARNITYAILLILALVCVDCGQSLLAQTQIHGSTLDKHGGPAAFINVVVLSMGSKKILAFAISDANGMYSMIVNNTADSLELTASSLHYASQTKHVKNVSQEVVFFLEPDVKQLETFTVRASRIERKGDTISYLVQSFANRVDRSIEDVLRRMPGIEVEPGGRILYQGLPIQKFYVEGLDLMDGRYVAVSVNMPHTVVSTVEVLENHQPVRILEDRVSSQQASLNIRLKKNITTTGTAKLGTGYGPGVLWDANVSPMAFTKDFQLFGSYQANNTGQDVARQLKAVGFQDMLLHPEKTFQDYSPLNVRSAKIPLTDQVRFLFNNIHQVNLNGLIRLKNDLLLRANIHFVNDWQQQKAVANRVVYAPADTIAFNESLNNRYLDQLLRGVFTLSRNTKFNYLQNKFSFETGQVSHIGLLDDGKGTVEQLLERPFVSVSNDMRTVFPIGRELIEIISFVTYDENDHELFVSPGVFEGALNNNTAYSQTRQNVFYKRLYAHHSAGFAFRWKGLGITHSAGLISRAQSFESHIAIGSGENQTIAGSDYENSLRFLLMRPYFKTIFEFKNKGLTIKTDLPLSFNRLVHDGMLSDGINRFFFEPKLSVFYQFKGFWQAGGTYSHANSLGNLEEMYDGFVLRNYNTLFRNLSPPEVTKSSSASLRLSYRNPITAFFNSFTYVYGRRSDAVLYSTRMHLNGSTEIVLLDLPNKGNFHNLILTSSKYLPASQSTISLKASYSLNKSVALLNNELFNVENRLLLLSPQINTQITSLLNSEYRFELKRLTTTPVKRAIHLAAYEKHHINLFTFLSKSIMLSFMNEVYRSSSMLGWFSDIHYRHRIKNRNLDLEIQWSNIFNAKSYIDLQASTYMFYEYTYHIRPSQVSASLRWSL
jgi:hypothetical protein